ncbi:MAG: asparagine synthase-related protein [Sphingomonas sp.]
MIETHWGAYLAILVGPEGPLLVRDPSGLMPCYYQCRDGHVLVASDMAWARLAGDFAPEICWSEIHAQLQYYSRRTARTALETISELPPGSALQLGKGALRSVPLWNPYAFTAAWDSPIALAEAADRLRRAASLSIGAWARASSRPLVEISGGLDSSIVAAASAPNAAMLQAVTFRGGPADLDETPYARTVADHLGIPLHCELLSTEVVDLRKSAAVDLPRPTVRSFSQANDRQALELGQRIGCDAFFVGTGGDNVLWYFNTAAPALDRLRIEGVGGFLRTIGDLAEMCEVPWTTALAIAIRKQLQRRPRPWPQMLLFLSPQGRQPASVPPHPWWPAPPGTLPGVRAYVRALIQMYDHHDYHLRAAHAPVISPLVSQPIVEACLRIPSWLSCTGGNNRAVARAAFADALPAGIIGRRTKGGFDGFVHNLLERNRAVAREMLLDGQLAKGGWLDREAIDHCLANPAPIPPDWSNRLMRLIAVETWLESVRSRRDG